MRNITRKHAVMMEYVIIAVLIAAAVNFQCGIEQPNDAGRF